MSANCERIEKLISKALLEGLTADEKKDLDSHLLACNGCLEEQQRCIRTVERLRNVPTVPIPRHFFVYKDAQQPWFQRLTGIPQGPWKLAAWATGLALLAFIPPALSKLHLRRDDGVLMVRFGEALASRSAPASPPNPSLSPELRRELIQVIDERSDRKSAEIMVALRKEILRAQASSTRKQKREWELLLSGLEARAGHRWEEQRASLKTEMNETMARLYRTLQAQRQKDLSVIQVRMNRMAADGLMKDKETEEILSTLLQVAEVK